MKDPKRQYIKNYPEKGYYQKRAKIELKAKATTKLNQIA